MRNTLILIGQIHENQREALSAVFDLVSHQAAAGERR
jgi:hypothetical protein